ncbi:MAG: response regulator [Ignavibacteria bacterium]|jgi:DNA-binding response OmpR family regulator|nr:response regulator [Ignavibacteriota bacterium]
MSEVKKKVLLVDDDVDLIEQNKMLLESKGYEVVTAENVKDAWDTFQKEKPDAAVLDLIMEEHDSGFVLAHKIKRDAYGKTIPVFLLTSATYVTGMKFGVSSSEEQEWINCDAWFNKPINIDELSNKLEECLEKYGK